MAIIPGMTELTRPYWDAAREERLVVQECQQCRQLWHPPLPACPHCHGSLLGWREVSGAGTVYTYAVVRHATHLAFADKIPYMIAIVELAEGPRLVTGITGCPPCVLTGSGLSGPVPWSRTYRHPAPSGANP